MHIRVSIAQELKSERIARLHVCVQEFEKVLVSSKIDFAMSTRFANTPTRNDAQTMQKARHQLAALLDRIRELNGWSDTDIVRRATASGETLSKSNISRVRNTDVVSLTGTTIKGLAAGLGIPPGEVARAALESMGITLADAGSLDLETVIKTDSTLSNDNREMLLGLVSQMRYLETKRMGNEDTGTQDATSNPTVDGKAGTRGTPMKPKHPDNVRQLTRPNQPKEVDEEFDDTAPPPEALDFVARETPPGYKKGYDIDRGDDDS